MLEKSVRMMLELYRIVVFLRISFLFDVGEKRMINVVEKETV